MLGSKTMVPSWSFCTEKNRWANYCALILPTCVLAHAPDFLWFPSILAATELVQTWSQISEVLITVDHWLLLSLCCRNWLDYFFSEVLNQWASQQTCLESLRLSKAWSELMAGWSYPLGLEEINILHRLIVPLALDSKWPLFIKLIWIALVDGLMFCSSIPLGTPRMSFR